MPKNAHGEQNSKILNKDGMDVADIPFNLKLQTLVLQPPLQQVAGALG
jgi:hypothetical protein